MQFTASAAKVLEPDHTGHLQRSCASLKDQSCFDGTRGVLHNIRQVALVL